MCLVLNLPRIKPGSYCHPTNCGTLAQDFVPVPQLWALWFWTSATCPLKSLGGRFLSPAF